MSENADLSWERHQLSVLKELKGLTDNSRETVGTLSVITSNVTRISILQDQLREAQAEQSRDVEELSIRFYEYKEKVAVDLALLNKSMNESVKNRAIFVAAAVSLVAQLISYLVGHIPK